MKSKVLFLSLLFIVLGLGEFVLADSPVARAGGGELEKEPILYKDNISLLEPDKWVFFNWFNCVDNIQMFLEARVPYLFELSEKRENKLWDEINRYVNVRSDIVLNPKVALALLELKGEVLSNSKLSGADLEDNILKINNSGFSEYQKIVNSRNISGLSSEIKSFREALEYLSVNANSLYYLDKYFDKDGLNNLDKKFKEENPYWFYFRNKDGVNVNIIDIPAETVMLWNILAKLAENKTEWELWISDNPGSFSDVYKTWFGDKKYLDVSLCQEGVKPEVVGSNKAETPPVVEKITENKVEAEVQQDAYKLIKYLAVLLGLISAWLVFYWVRRRKNNTNNEIR